jgi:hypothetical protein
MGIENLIEAADKSAAKDNKEAFFKTLGFPTSIGISGILTRKSIIN